MSTESSINKRIQKLLRLAEHPNTPPHEAEVAGRQAEKLMLKLGINEAMLRASLGDDEKPEAIVIKYTSEFPKLFVKARMHVTASVARGMRLKVWIVGGNKVAMMGFESDVDRALVLASSLLLQADQAQAVWWRNYEFREHLKQSEAMRARREFLFGFGNEVQMRLKQLTQENIAESDAEVGTTSTALVLRNRDQQLDDEFNRLMGGRLRPARGLKGSYHGGEAGRAAGQSANLGGTSLGGGSRGVLGG